MSVWVVLAQGILALGALAIIAYPLIKKEGVGTLAHGGADDIQAEREDLLGAKRVTYEAIRELELDWKSGKLSEADYQAMRRELEAEAIGVLQKLDALEDHEAPSPEVDKSRCPSCNKKIETTHTFCPACGTKLY